MHMTQFPPRFVRPQGFSNMLYRGACSNLVYHWELISISARAAAASKVSKKSWPRKGNSNLSLQQCKLSQPPPYRTVHQDKVRAFLNSGCEVNVMRPDYVRKLGLKIRKTIVGAKKIDGFSLDTFGMVIANFQVEDKVGRPRCFRKTFLVADSKVEIILRMHFLKFNYADMLFRDETLTWKSYTTNKTLSTIQQVQIIDSKKFVIAALDADSKMFVIHVTIQE